MAEIADYQTVASALADTAARRPDAVAYIDGNQSFTFGEIEQASARLACGLLKLGCVRGDRVGVMALNQIEWVQLFFAAARIGVAVVGLNVRYRDREIEYMANDSGMKLVFTLDRHDGFDCIAMFESLADRMPSVRQVVTIASDHSSPDTGFAAVADTPLDEQALALGQSRLTPHDLVMVIYTSGTTGRPKGTAITHASILASAGAQARHVGANPEDHLQLAVPLNHVGGITCGILTHLLGGGTCELVPVFQADVVLDMMRRRPPTLVTGVPTMLTLLLMSPASQEVDFGSVRLITAGGSSVDDTLLARLKQRMPQATLMNLYGLSESSGAIVMTPHDCDEQDLMHTIGRPLAGAEVRVVTADEETAAYGEVGELRFRGLGVIAGYIGAAADRSPIDAEGWLQTGDLGELDERGFIRMRGRKKEMYIQGGYNIYPAEVESHIARHSKVLMVAGIGVPDPVMGEVGRYYIVPRPDSRLTEQEILEHCSGAIADYKMPRQIVFRDDLPLTPAGKIKKVALKAEDTERRESD